MAKTITVRVDDTVYEILKKAADGDKRTISNFMEYAAMNYILTDSIADDNEMAEILYNERDLKKGLSDIEKGRYKIVG
ncbi:CopG family transcriptional regulator [Breznakiella homolactica]|uniref:CopG family transcriptional regulator n=1 Tax=Breznakiella homolactica TaxID=2798577 RepID=A0A7T8B8S2_9SPIR|nr:CopG family transcriptional regulator [Breznakiella homolactica]QQO07611.1 CopG family transcriptional regulator [Breznakiella homolactica]